MSKSYAQKLKNLGIRRETKKIKEYIKQSNEGYTRLENPFKNLSSMDYQELCDREGLLVKSNKKGWFHLVGDMGNGVSMAVMIDSKFNPPNKPKNHLLLERYE